MGFDNPDGPLLCAALLRGHPLMGMRHVLQKVEGTIWHKVAKGLAGSLNGTGADKLVSATKGLRVAGHDEGQTRRTMLAKITAVDGLVEPWLRKDPRFERRRKINRKSYAEVADMFKGTQWLWPDWIPMGYLSMIAGRSGIGKSMVAAWWATHLLRGGKFPDGFEYEADPKAQVLWIDTEGTQKMLGERLTAMGAPIDRVFFPVGDKPEEQEFPLVDLSKPRWRDEVAGLAIDERPIWIVIDSLRGAHTAKEKDDRDMQQILAWAAALTRDLGCAFTFTHHIRKSMPGEPEEIVLDSLRGSSAIAAMMRSIIALDNPDPRAGTLRLHVIKSNLCAPPKHLGVDLALEGGMPVVAKSSPEPKRMETLTERACEFLRARLEKGPRTADEMYYEAEQAGISKRTLRVAKEKMGVVSVPRDTKHDKWRWALPAVPPDDRTKEGG